MSKTHRTRPRDDDEWDAGPRKGFTSARKRRDPHRARRPDEPRRAGAGRLPGWIVEQADTDDDVLERGRSSGLAGIRR